MNDDDDNGSGKWVLLGLLLLIGLGGIGIAMARSESERDRGAIGKPPGLAWSVVIDAAGVTIDGARYVDAREGWPSAAATANALGIGSDHTLTIDVSNAPAEWTGIFVEAARRLGAAVKLEG